MSGTTIANLASLRTFRGGCEQFEANMKKSMAQLEGAILAARSGWRDGGFDQIQRMVMNVRSGVSEIEKTVSSKVVPFVDEQIQWIESKPY